MKEGLMNCIVCDIKLNINNQYYGEIYRIISSPSLGGYKSLLIRCESDCTIDKEIAINVSESISDDRLVEMISCWVEQELRQDKPLLKIVGFEVRTNKQIIPRAVIAVIWMFISCCIHAANTEVVDGIEWEIATDSQTYTLESARRKDQWGGQGVRTSTKGVRPVDLSAVTGVITIPTSINGEKVTRICSAAFKDCAGLTGVIIPDGILEIGEAAFYNCTNLVSVDLGKVNYISIIAFGRSNDAKMNLKTIILPKELERIEKTSFAGSSYWVNDVIGNSGCFTYLENVAISDTKILSEPVLGRPGNSSEYGYKNGYFAGATVYTSEELYEVLRTRMLYGQWGESRYYKEIKIGWSNPAFVPATNVISCGDMVEIKSMSTNKNTKVFYTIDGSVPTNCVTENCFLYSQPIPITRKTKINAVAYVDNDSIYAEVSSIEYGFGAIGAIRLSSTYSEKFYKSKNVIALSCETQDAEIRYTLDGSEPTEKSKLYTGPFTIDDTTTIKAKAFKTDWFDSETATAIFTREWYTVETPVIEPAGVEFGNTSQEISLACATDGATIYYTTDGSDPAVEGLEYKRPFTVYKSCTVRAVAVKDDYRNSPEATATFTRAEGLSEAANFFGRKMETGEDAPWIVDTEMSHDGVSSVRSGGDGSYLQMSVSGAGTLSFWWRAMCEDPDYEYYDYGCFKIGSDVVGRIAGADTGWEYFSTKISSKAKHVFRWEYHKDEEGTYHPDCIWVDRVQWTPADGSGQTMTTPYPVPYSWIDKYRLAAGTDYETAGNAFSGKTDGGRPTTVWEEYVAGLDPTNAASRLVAGIEMTDGGPVVTWSPNLNTNGVNRIYKVYGSETLENGGNWQYPTNSLHRFFKVGVEMP